MSDDKKVKRSPIPLDDCGMAHAAKLLGDKWSLLIIREAFYGVFRFDDMRRDLAIPRAVLSQRLNKLVELGILLKKPYKEEGKRPRDGYSLSQSGKAMLPVFVSMMQWGDQFVRQAPSRLLISDKQSSQPVKLDFVAKDGSIVNLSDLKFEYILPKK